MFQDGSNGEPAGQHRERAVAEARPEARAVRHDRGDGIPRAYLMPGLWPPPQSVLVRDPSRLADRLSPFHIRPGRIAGPHPLPSRQFQALFDSLFKVLFIFPSRYLFAIGLSPVFSLGLISEIRSYDLHNRIKLGSVLKSIFTLKGPKYQHSS